MGKHKGYECPVPPAAGSKSYTWRCPACGLGWTWDPKAETGATRWRDEDDVRDAGGSKPGKGGLLTWLTR